MARQYKKILKKLKPKENKTDKKPEKIGKDYLLIAILSLTIVFMIVGWTNLDNYNRALYVMLTVSLSTTYARRHANLTETQGLWVERVGYVTMGVAVVLFVFVVYQKAA